MVKKTGYLFVVLLLLFFIASCSFFSDKTEEEHQSKDDLPPSSQSPIEEEEPSPAESNQLEDMSLDEKIGQMIIAGISGTTISEDTKSLISQYQVGGLIAYKVNMEDPKQAVQLLNSLKVENAKNQFPLFLSIDQEGGHISRLPGGLIEIPTNEKIGSINNSQFSYEIGTLLGKELETFGFNLNYAPVLDVNSNPDNPIIGNRSFGNNPEIVSELGIQTMKGIQSQNIIPVIKHFPGHGDTSVDSHLELPKVNKSLEELKQVELVPFADAIESGADVVMVAHILLPEIDAIYPSSMSKTIMTDLLRKQLHFNGVVMTDDMTMSAIADNFDLGEAAVESVKAGSDIVMVAHDYNKIVSVINALKTAVLNGEIPEARVDESVSRIIQLKKKYKLDGETVEEVNVEELNHEIEKILNRYVN
jgi:beta-N-acetylhexosaminidase